MDYRFVHYGEAKPGLSWGDLYPNGCSDEKNMFQQSPIIIDNIDQIEPVSTPALFVMPEFDSGFTFDRGISLHAHPVRNYSDSMYYGMNLKVLSKYMPSIVKDGLEYKFNHMHFHLGGAEHEIVSNPSVDMTLHVVHHNIQADKYAVVEVQLYFGEDGIDLGMSCPTHCVVCGQANCLLHPLQEKENICDLPNGWTTADYMNGWEYRQSWFSWLNISSSLDNYITYKGGLTTPPCDKDVTFYIRKEPVKVREMLHCDILREYLETATCQSGSGQELGRKCTGNVRSPQKLKDFTKIQLN